MSNDPPEPPAHLGTAGKRFWIDVQAENEGFEAQETAILELACLALDRERSARDRVRRDGLTINGARGALIAHPALAVERQAARSFALLVKALDLKDPPPERHHGGRRRMGPLSGRVVRQP